MFPLALLIGIYSYLIFFLGILGLLYKPLVFISTIAYLLIVMIIYRRKIKGLFRKFDVNGKLKWLKQNKMFSLILLVILAQALVNLIGVLGPEISFDSLWYHLTLPKLYILNHQIMHIPGNQLFYSDMPKLTEMLYTTAISMGNEILAKFIHYLFGVLVLIGTYNIARRYMSKEFSILASAIFYANLVVGWEVVTAYIDLSRTFFELMAFWGFLQWWEKDEKKSLVMSGVMMGLAVTTKLVAVGSILIFFCLFLFKMFSKKESVLKTVKDFSVFTLLSFLIPLPWLIFSYLNTENPFYPYLSSIPLDSSANFMFINFPNVLNFPKDIYNFFLRLNDPISPIYLITLPLIIVYFRKFAPKARLLLIYSFLALAIWYLVEQVRGGRFILPYLPIFSVLAAYSISLLNSRRLKAFLIFTVIFVSVLSIGYRAIANSKFVPVILGRETQNQFLADHLNFSFGDFADIDDYFQKRLNKTDVVLLYGFSKFFYVDFNFVDSSWVKKGDKFNYIATQNTTLPARFSDWNQIYYNKITGVRLYTKEGKTWVY